jgi:hypothetical protein
LPAALRSRARLLDFLRLTFVEPGELIARFMLGAPQLVELGVNRLRVAMLRAPSDQRHGPGGERGANAIARRGMPSPRLFGGNRLRLGDGRHVPDDRLWRRRGGFQRLRRNPYARNGQDQADEREAPRR